MIPSTAARRSGVAFLWLRMAVARLTVVSLTRSIFAALDRSIDLSTRSPRRPQPCERGALNVRFAPKATELRNWTGRGA